MPRLNDQFMEAFTDDGHTLKLERPIGYVILEHEQDGVRVEVGIGMWQEPHISVSGEWSGGITKGGVALNRGGRTFRNSDVFEPGLHASVNDEEGDRRYWIVDSPEEEVLVSIWNPDTPTHDEEGFPTRGLYGDFQTASPEDTETIKQNAQRVIDAARMAIDASVASQA